MTEDLSIIGYSFEAAYILGDGIILRLAPPPVVALSAQDPEQPVIHIAFYPAVNVNLPPGVEPNPETLMHAAATAEKILYVKTHTGELPEEMRLQLQEPAEFGKLKGMAITSTTPASDTPNGLNLIFGFQYRLQIDLTGAYVYPLVAIQEQ